MQSLTEFATSNVVISANAFNPSVFRESFLVKVGVLASIDIAPGSVFSDQVDAVQTSRFHLAVVPQQFVVTPILRKDAADVVCSVVPPVIAALPHTPYVAAGLNFVWHIKPPGDQPLATRKHFSAHASILGDVFDTADARFGFVASKDVGDVRLKADIKPIYVIAPNGPRRDLIQCLYNFHVDLLQEDASSKVTELCARWTEFDNLSEDLTDRLTEGL